jgi:DNA-directed RNA polymerase specialized sigma24 family protein
MLLIAIRTYDENCGKTFNKYFEMILIRRLYRLISREKTYLNDVELIDDEYVLSEPNVFVYEDSFNVDENLSTLEKKVLILKEKNYRPKDIANKLGCDVKSVYNCLCRIKDKIKR